MIIKYRQYIGAVIYMQQVKGSLFKFKIKDTEGITIEFMADIFEIKIIDCIANENILSDIKRNRGE